MCKNMRRDYFVVWIIIGCTIASTIIFISKKNIRKAFFAFLVAQSATWPIGLLLTAWGKIEYPVRLFPKAVKSSFLNGYILNPVIFAIYYIHYPKQAKLIWRWVYTLFVTSVPILVEILENKYTNLIKYKNWHSYYTWLIGIVAYYIIRKYIDWFFKNAPKQGV
jgi:hypothetical protein